MSALNPPVGRPGVLADLIPGQGAMVVMRDISLVVGGAAITGLAAQVSFTIPSISPVPYTLQTFAVLLVGASLGTLRGLTSMALYVVAGLAGVPWFAGAASGMDAARITLGYLAGFIAAAALVGFLSSRGNDRRFLSSTAEMFLGTLVIYACGVPVLMSALDVNLAQGLEYGLYPFVLTDTLKVLAAAGLLPLAWKLVNRSSD
ncbi:MAG: biotin transporter BioY [Actinomycetota bacterium]|nr:biotin transporter BioY [Actinomycetota bacterium]